MLSDGRPRDVTPDTPEAMFTRFCARVRHSFVLTPLMTEAPADYMLLLVGASCYYDSPLPTSVSNIIVP